MIALLLTTAAELDALPVNAPIASVRAAVLAIHDTDSRWRVDGTWFPWFYSPETLLRDFGPFTPLVPAVRIETLP